MAEVDDTEQNVMMCEEFCGNCPSFPGVEGEILYCARGPSDEDIEREGCNCPDCPVWIKCGLSKQYYCDGS